MFFYVTQSISFHENSVYVFEFASIRIWKVKKYRPSMFDFITMRSIAPWINGWIVTSVTHCYGSSASRNVREFFENFKFFFYRNLYYLRPAATTYHTKRRPVDGRFTLSVSSESVLTLATFENRRTVSIDTVKTYWTSFERRFAHISWPRWRFVLLYYRLEIRSSWKSLKQRLVGVRWIFSNFCFYSPLF